MTTVVARAVLAPVLFGTGILCLAAGRLEQQSAQALRHMASMSFAEAVDAYDRLEEAAGVAVYLPVYGAGRLEEARARRAVATYWLSDYASLPLPSPDGAQTDTPDPDLMLAAANAAYRAAAEADRESGGMAKVLEAYAQVLERVPGHVDAAYNYELVARQLGGGAVPDEDAEAAAPTIHGTPGAPPEGADMGQFKVVIPKRGEERQEDSEAGAGRTRIRRG